MVEHLRREERTMDGVTKRSYYIKSVEKQCFQPERRNAPENTSATRIYTDTVIYLASQMRGRFGSSCKVCRRAGQRAGGTAVNRTMLHSASSIFDGIEPGVMIPIDVANYLGPYRQFHGQELCDWLGCRRSIIRSAPNSRNLTLTSTRPPR